MSGIVGPLAVLISLAQGAPVATTDNVILSLSRQYGRAVFSQCRLDIVVYASQGNATLWCDSTAADSKGRPVPDVNAHQQLPSDDTKRLAAIVRSARLFDGGHSGTDTRARDGHFETIKLLQDGQAVVLVTSGNPTFDREGPRKQLLSMLSDIEKRLLEKARAPVARAGRHGVSQHRRARVSADGPRSPSSAVAARSPLVRATPGGSRAGGSG